MSDHAIDAAWHKARREYSDLVEERDKLLDALQAAQHWHEQMDYDEALNVIDAALGDVWAGSRRAER